MSRVEQLEAGAQIKREQNPARPPHGEELNAAPPPPQSICKQTLKYE